MVINIPSRFNVFSSLKCLISLFTILPNSLPPIGNLHCCAEVIKATNNLNLHIGKPGLLKFCHSQGEKFSIITDLLLKKFGSNEDYSK